MRLLVWILVSHFGTYDVVLNTYESWGQCQAERLRIIEMVNAVPAQLSCAPDTEGQ